MLSSKKELTFKEVEMFFYKLVTQFQLVSFILLNIILIDAVQMGTVVRKGFGQIVSLSGYYGDRVLIILILIISSVLTKNQAQFKSSTIIQIMIVVVIYAVSLFVERCYSVASTPEDMYHKWVVLPAFVIILLCGGIKALEYANRTQMLMMLLCFSVWLSLFVIDVKYDRLDQARFMKRHMLQP